MVSGVLVLFSGGAKVGVICAFPVVLVGRSLAGESFCEQALSAIEQKKNKIHRTLVRFTDITCPPDNAIPLPQIYGTRNSYLAPGFSQICLWLALSFLIRSQWDAARQHRGGRLPA